MQFWILKADQMHKILKKIRYKIADSGARDALFGLDGIVQDFDELDSGDGMSKGMLLAGAAFGLGSTIFGDSWGGVAGGLFSRVGIANPGGDNAEPWDADMPSIKDKAHRYLDAVGEARKETLANVTGTGDQRDLPLEDQSGLEDYATELSVSLLVTRGSWPLTTQQRCQSLAIPKPPVRTPR